MNSEDPDQPEIASAGISLFPNSDLHRVGSQGSDQTGMDIQTGAWIFAV